MSHLDRGLHSESVAAPGTDTRQWVSYGTVEPETPGQRSVTFSPAYGPLVSVKLHPSGLPVVCRVVHGVAGNGESDWFPFVAGDEVLVAIPEGDETAGCCIVGRLNQEIDVFPTSVAGQDPTQNNFAFRRMRTPYVFETEAGYLLRNAVTGAFFSLSSVGAFTLAANSGKDFLALTADFLGLQNADADCLLQIALEKKQVVAQAAGTLLTLDKSMSFLYTKGVLQLGTSGNPAGGHAATVEGVVNLISLIVTGIGALLTVPLTPPAVIALVNTALAASGSNTIAPYASAISAALAAPQVSGVKPGLGAPGLLIG